jgi:hypothetical protein
MTTNTTGTSKALWRVGCGMSAQRKRNPLESCVQVVTNAYVLHFQEDRYSAVCKEVQRCIRRPKISL